MKTFRKSKKEPFTDSSSNLNLNLYELVSIINQMTGKCKGYALICIHQREAPKSKAPLWRAMW